MVFSKSRGKENCFLRSQAQGKAVNKVGAAVAPQHHVFLHPVPLGGGTDQSPALGVGIALAQDPLLGGAQDRLGCSGGIQTDGEVQQSSIAAVYISPVNDLFHHFSPLTTI